MTSPRQISVRFDDGTTKRYFPVWRYRDGTGGEYLYVSDAPLNGDHPNLVRVFLITGRRQGQLIPVAHIHSPKLVHALLETCAEENVFPVADINKVVVTESSVEVLYDLCTLVELNEEYYGVYRADPASLRPGETASYYICKYKVTDGFLERQDIDDEELAHRVLDEVAGTAPVTIIVNGVPTTYFVIMMREFRDDDGDGASMFVALRREDQETPEEADDEEEDEIIVRPFSEDKHGRACYEGEVPEHIRRTIMDELMRQTTEEIDLTEDAGVDDVVGVPVYQRRAFGDA